MREGADIKVYGFEVPVDWWFWYALLHEAGGTLLTPDGKKAAFREKGGEALQFWVDLVNKDKTMKRPPGKDYNAWEVTNTDFINQRVAMIYTSTAFLNYMTENAKFKLGTAFLPGKVKQAVPTGGTFFVIARDAPARPEGGRVGLHQVDDRARPDHLALQGHRLHADPHLRRELARDAGLLQAEPELQDRDRPAPDGPEVPVHPGLIEIQREVIQPNLEAAVIGIKTSAEIMQAAEAKANEILSK